MITLHPSVYILFIECLFKRTCLNTTESEQGEKTLRLLLMLIKESVCLDLIHTHT